MVSSIGYFCRSNPDSIGCSHSSFCRKLCTSYMYGCILHCEVDNSSVVYASRVFGNSSWSDSNIVDILISEIAGSSCWMPKHQPRAAEPRLPRQVGELVDYKPCLIFSIALSHSLPHSLTDFLECLYRNQTCVSLR